jgi:hypothetical protein
VLTLLTAAAVAALASLHAQGLPRKDLLVTAGYMWGLLTFLSSFSPSFPLPMLFLHPPQLPYCFHFISFWMQNPYWPIIWHISSKPMWLIKEVIDATLSYCMFVYLMSMFLACYVSMMLPYGGLGSLLVMVWIDDVWQLAGHDYDWSGMYV